MSAANLNKFAASLRNLPRVVAQKVALSAAPALTAQGTATFNAGENAYGITWAPLSSGERATLTKSGALKAKLVYAAIGTKLRVALGVAYAKYVIGKRQVFPRAGAALPATYTAALERSTVAVCKAELGQ